MIQKKNDLFLSEREFIRESSAPPEPDKNNWMKENPSGSNSKYTFKADGTEAASSNKKSLVAFKTHNDSNTSVEGHILLSPRKKQELNTIYKGMPYDEWTKVRDQFLKSHNML